jgi:hypothetical protein
MTRAASVKDGLCGVCGVKPRGAGGKLTRCLACLKADVDRERRHREAKVREKSKTPAARISVERNYALKDHHGEQG